jgi:hypothetical protein
MGVCDDGSGMGQRVKQSVATSVNRVGRSLQGACEIVASCIVVVAKAY